MMQIEGRGQIERNSDYLLSYAYVGQRDVALEEMATGSEHQGIFCFNWIYMYI